MKKVFVDTNVVLDFLLKRKDVFEDALQYTSAKTIEADCIVTRNIKDFLFSKIELLTPEEFVLKMKESIKIEK